MFRLSSSRTPVGSSQRWRRRIAGWAAALAGSAAALAGSEAAPAAPTAPPPVSILTSSPFVGQGYFFISPFGDQSTYANGPEILDPSGNVVWFHAVPQGQDASDFRVQRYHGPDH